MFVQSDNSFREVYYQVKDNDSCSDTTSQTSYDTLYDE
jgi:hypothetical protein